VGAVELSYCIVNTGQRELLLAGLDAVAREQERVPFGTEVLVLDNASQDGSAEAALAHPAVDRVIALDRRRGKAENDSEILQQASGRFALMLNEDSELLPGATEALHGALEADAGAAAAGARLLRPDGTPQPSAWAFPGPRSALASALFVHRWTTVQSRGEQTRPVDWSQSAALLVRREAVEEIGWLDPDFFVYSDEVDLCRRLADHGWQTIYVPSAEAIHHEQLSTGSVPGRRIVEMSRNRDLYMRKHHSAAAAAIVRWLTAWAYAVRALAATVLPGHDPDRYMAHVRATLHPGRGEGLREAAEEFNRAAAGSSPTG